MRVPGRQRERLKPEPGLRVAGRELEVGAADEAGQPAVGAAQVQDQHAGAVLERLDQKKIQGETLAGARRAEDQRVAHVAREQIVVIRGAPRGLEDRERLAAEVPAPGRAPGRPEHRREARGEPGRDEHRSHLPPRRLGREPREPDGQLAVALPDRLRVVRREEPPHVAVQALDLAQVAVERHRQRGLAVAHAVRLEFHERAAQPVRLDRCGRIDHRGRRALGLLHVRHHRVAAREVVALRAPDPAPRRLDRPRSPLEGDRERGIETVQVAQQVRVRLARRRQERVQDHRLAVERQMRTLRFQFRHREPPVHAAARRPVPRRARPVRQFGKQPGCFRGSQHLDRCVFGDE